MGLFKKLKGIFSKPAQQSSKPKSPIQKVAIIVGHGNGDSGAMGWNGVSEFDYNSAVAKSLEISDTGKEIKVFHRSASGITGVAASAVAWKPDMVIELHLNAFNGKAIGCEVLCLEGKTSSGEKAVDFADKFTKKFSRVKRRSNGVNWISSSDRGGLSLKKLSSVQYSILVEPFFIDNKNEWIDQQDYAGFLKEWIKGL